MTSEHEARFRVLMSEWHERSSALFNARRDREADEVWQCTKDLIEVIVEINAEAKS